MTHTAAPERYDAMPYRRVGRSGLLLPAISLGLWHNFGSDRDLDGRRAILRRAFDLGVTHIDLANNYGPPPGSAEETFGEALRRDLHPYRDELVISTKAGYEMWPGPYGDGGSRKYLLDSLDASLRRMGIDHVDVFYSHRPDPDTPVEETMGALHSAVQSGKARYVGISNHSPEQTVAAAAALTALGTPLLIHQENYSLFRRSADSGLLATLDDLGVGSIAFSPLAQGVLTDRYLDGIPADSRAAGPSSSLDASRITDSTMATVRALDGIARGRGQTLAQLAIAWVLRPGGMTSALIGASSVAQLEANVAATIGPELTADELAAIDACLAAGTG